MTAYQDSIFELKSKWERAEPTAASVAALASRGATAHRVVVVTPWRELAIDCLTYADLEAAARRVRRDERAHGTLVGVRMTTGDRVSVVVHRCERGAWVDVTDSLTVEPTETRR